MKKSNKRSLILAGLLGLALGIGGLTLKQNRDAKAAEAALNSTKYADYPVCLTEQGSPSAYVIMEGDSETNTYKGIRVLLIFQVPFEVSARSLNVREDLVQVDCETGKPVGQ